MITRNRFALAQLSIGCFRRQTWPARELIVLDDSEDDRLATWIASLADPTIRFFSVRGSTETLGALRNRSLALAAGSLVCQWDDDDLQHPARLELALAAMAATKTSVCLLAHEVIWMPHLARLGILAQRPWPQENTLLTVRDEALDYPSLARGEDTVVIRKLLDRRQAVLLAMPELYIYIMHGRNTWDTAHMEKLWTVSRDRTEGSPSAPRLAQLARSYPIAEYAARIGAPPQSG